MDEVEDIEFEEVDSAKDSTKQYDELSSEMKDNIARIQGQKNVFDSSDTKTYLLGAALGGGFAVYKRKKVLVGVAFGLLCAYFYVEFLEKPSKETNNDADGESTTQAK